MTVGASANDGLRWIIALVATAIVVAAVVISKRRPIAVSEDVPA